MGTSSWTGRRAGLLLHVTGSASLAAGLLAFVPGVSPSASAAPIASFTSTPITVVDASTVDRGLAVSGLGGRLIDVDVVLDDVTHTFPDDLDVSLVSPAGTTVLLVGDSGDDTDVVDADWTFDDSATALPPNGDGFVTGTYRTGGSTTNALGAFAGEDPNGTWTLRVVDDRAGDVGDVGGGFTLRIQTSTACSAAGGQVPSNAGAAAGLVLSTTVAGLGSAFDDVDVVLFGMELRRVEDLDVVVQAPNGDAAVLFSDVADGATYQDLAYEIDDQAGAAIPAGPTRSGRWTPTNVGGGDGLPASMGAVLPTASLADLEDSSPNGTWNVGFRDDQIAGGNSTVGGFCLDLAAANSAPTAAPLGTLTTDEDTAIPITLLGADADTGQPLTYSITSQPAQGTVTQVAGANWLYTPPAGFSNPSPDALLAFTYQVTDGTASASAGGSIRVLPVDDAPLATDQAVGTDEDVALPITLTSTDEDGGAPTYTIVSGPVNGTLTGAGASRTYTPAGDFHGVDGFTFLVDDGAGGTDEGTVAITVDAVDDPPVAGDDSYGTAEDVALVVPAASGVLAGDVDGDPEVFQPLTATLVAGPANGVLALDADGGFTYTPDADFTGIDAFTYQASDGTSTSDVATASIDVGGVNDAPTTDDQAVSTDEDVALPITLTGDDADGDPLGFAVVDQPDHGTLTGTAPTLTYTPDPDFHGADSFTFTVGDGSEVAGGTASITVEPVDDQPEPSTDAFVTDEDVALVVGAASGVLADDVDRDGDPLVASLVLAPGHGGLTLGSDGSFTYTPDPDFHGPDSFTYAVGDGTGLDVGPVTVSLTVAPVDDAPVAVADDAPGHTVAEDAVLVVPADGVLGNDSDVDGDPLSAVLVTAPAHGTLDLAADGGFTYTPDPDFHGADGFTYLVDDGAAEAGAAGAAGGVRPAATSPAVAVAITVTAVPDVPVAADDTATVAAGGEVAVDVLANDTDGDGDPLEVLSASEPTRGEVACAAAGCTFTAPDGDPGGVVSFDYEVGDGEGGTDTASVSVTVLAAGVTPEPSTTTTTETTTTTTTTIAGRPTSTTVAAPSTTAAVGAGALPRTGDDGAAWRLGAFLVGLGMLLSGAGLAAGRRGAGAS